MPKTKTVFVCSNCGYESTKWLGKCPGCNEWNTFYEEKLTKSNNSYKSDKTRSAIPRPLKEVVGKDTVRTKTGFEELDRVLRRRAS